MKKLAFALFLITSFAAICIAPQSAFSGQSDSVSVRVTVNDAPPVGSISINDGAQYASAIAVTLKLSAADSGSAVTQMQFSNNNSTWSTAETYATSKAWNVTSGDGAKTVYVKFKDSMGHWSGAFSDTITLDTTAPVIVITSPADGATVSSPDLTVEYTVDGTVMTRQFILNAGQNTITISEQDGAGNHSSVSIIVNYVIIPSLPSVVTTDGYRVMVQKRNTDNTLMPVAPYIVKGVNWSPAGKDTTGPDVSETGMRNEIGVWCDIDIPLIKAMNANTIRTFQDFGLTGDSYFRDWKYVLDRCYENDIMVIMTVDRCIADKARIQQIVDTYKNHPAVLMWLIGNEWTINKFYGAVGSIDEGAIALEEAASLVKALDAGHPVATSVGDLNYPAFATMKDIIVNRCPSVDVWGFNLYRGRTFNNLFDQWRDIGLESAKKPLIITEFGCDAYDINVGAEDQVGQRTTEYYQWADLAKNLSASDPAKTSAGGCVFEFNDEWWKVRWTAGVHNTEGWATNNCPDGHASEEWWGLVDIDRNPRPAYQLFKEYFGGLIPTPPPADPRQDVGVVRFSTQPDTITTNIASYLVADVFEDTTEVSVNNEIITLDYYNGFIKYLTLSSGSNIISLKVKFADGTESIFPKTIIYDPNYSTSGKKLVYVNDVVVDLDAGACIGRLPFVVTAITHDGKYITDKYANVYSTANNSFTGKTLNFNAVLHYPVFSNNDATVYSHNQVLDFAANSILSNQMPVDITADSCSIDASGYIYYGLYGDLKKIDPVSFSVVQDLSGVFGWSADRNFCVSGDGALAFGARTTGSSIVNVVDIAAADNLQLWLPSDWTGDIAQSIDGTKTFVGTYGNSWYGKGGLFFIDNVTRTESSIYHQFGARRLTVSPDYILATSTVVDHHFVDDAIPEGQVVQGSIYHRGVEAIEFNAQSQFVYKKSFFLGLSHNYNMPVKLFYKKGY